ncbi:hypothetical protein BC835DRAFT_1445629 [Cytidiella melzeri]|nr:hypothetical protein BC835DRAFT_1445629 [Cytidiella melzeri]
MSSSAEQAAELAAEIAAIKYSFGPLLITFPLAFIVYGIFLAQAYYYYINYESDGLKLRLYVAFIACVECFHTAMCMHVIYFYFIEHYGDPVNGVYQIVCSQSFASFYVRRIWLLSEKKIYAIVLPLLLMAARIAMASVSIHNLYDFKLWPVFNSQISAIHNIEGTFAVGLATDLLITGTLVWYLGARRTGFTHIFSAAVVATVTIKNNLLFGGLVEILTKLYATSMLATFQLIVSLVRLNARKLIQKDDGPSQLSGGYQFGTIRTGPHHIHDPRITFGESNSFALNDRPTVVDYTKDALGDYKASSENAMEHAV